MRRKGLVLVLAITMAASLFGGCKSTQTTDLSAGSTAAEDERAAGREEGTEISETAQGEAKLAWDLEGEHSWNKDKTPITVEWFVAYDWYNKVFDPATNIADKQLVDQTGITINITTGDVEKLNALIASGDLPDIITYDAASSQRVQMENAGMLYSLDELAEQYAPDLNVPQSQKDWYRNADDQWYAMISFYYGEERANKDYGGFLVTHANNFVRTDLLEQIGMTMEDLKTKEGLFQALKAVKDQKLTYEGLEVVPLIGVDEENVSYLSQQLGIMLEDEKGNLLDRRLQPEYLEAVEFYNQCWNAGLFTENELTEDENTRKEKIASGQAFFCTGWTKVANGRSALYSHDNNAQMLYCGQIEPDESENEQYLSSVASGGWSATMIAKDSEYADRIITLFAYLTQESVTLDEDFGCGCYDIVDGVAKVRPEIKQEYAEDYDAAYSKYNMNIRYALDYTIHQKYQDLDTVSVLEQDQNEMERDPHIQLFDDKCFTYVSPEAGTDLSAIEASIDNYWKAQIPQMIMAGSREECDVMYQQSVEQMKTMGLEELSAYKNQRFQENKNKLGIKYAWPSLQN